MNVHRTGWMALVLAALLGATSVRADDLRDRVERMEQELRELKEELRRREAPAPEGVPPAATTSQAEEKPAPVEKAPAATAKAEPEAVPAYRQVLDRVKLGGYGSFRFESSSLEDQKNTFTYRRFVLTTDAVIAPRMRGYMELEFERFRELELEKVIEPEEGGLTVEQTVEGTNESEIAFEQGWLQYDLANWFRFRGGEVLVPLGRFNLYHDDNLWDLPRRSLVDRGVPVLPVPAAWGELGAGFLGDLSVGREAMLNYQAYVVNGASLDVEFEQIAQTRFPEPGKTIIEAKIQPSTGTFGSDLKDAKAVTGRLAFSPKLGHELAGSWYYGQYTPDFLGTEDLWSLGLDGFTHYGPFELEGEFIFTRFEGIDAVAQNLARVARDQAVEFENPDLETEVEFELAGLARSKSGYWLDLRYRFWPEILNRTVLGSPFDNPQLVAIVRGEQVWLSDFITEVEFGGGRLTAFDTENRRIDRISAGLAYRPVPLVVFQLAYEFTQTNSGQSLAGVTNFLPAQEHEDHANAVLVGVAFGF